jgi:hypothetical protein
MLRSTLIFINHFLGEEGKILFVNLKKATEAFEKEVKKDPKKRTTRTVGGGRQNKKKEYAKYANMRCKAKHICYITKDGERTFQTLLMLDFLN